MWFHGYSFLTCSPYMRWASSTAIRNSSGFSTAMRASAISQPATFFFTPTPSGRLSSVNEEASAPNRSRFLAGLTKPEQFPVLVEVRETPQVADVPQPDEEERR